MSDAAEPTLTPGRAGAIGLAARLLYQDRAVPLPYTAGAVLARAAMRESSPPLAPLVAELRAAVADIVARADRVADTLAVVDAADGPEAINDTAAVALEALAALAGAAQVHADAGNAAIDAVRLFADGAAVALHLPADEIRQCPGREDDLYPCGAPLPPRASLCSQCAAVERHPEMFPPHL